MARTTATKAAAPSPSQGEADDKGQEIDPSKALKAAADKEAADKLAADELALKEAADKAAADELAQKEADAKAAADKEAADLAEKEAFEKKIAEELAQKEAAEAAQAAADAAAEEANPAFPVVLSVTNAQPGSLHISGTNETLAPGEARDIEFTEKAFKRFASTVEQLAELRGWECGEGVIVERGGLNG